MDFLKKRIFIFFEFLFFVFVSFNSFLEEGVRKGCAWYLSWVEMKDLGIGNWILV